MSHELGQRVTLPLTVPECTGLPAVLKLVSVKGLDNPDTALYRYTFPPDLGWCGPFDPWRLRDDFLTWPLEDWSAFFYMAGTFGGIRITRNDFVEWQRLMRKALLLPAREWKTLPGEFDSKKVSKLRAGLRVQCDWDADPPTATMSGPTSLESMIATIHVDKLQGAEFRECARPDCTNPPFRIGTRQKLYCGTACAHLVAVRNDRKRKAEQRDREEQL
jgi:hypothetical protein